MAHAKQAELVGTENADIVEGNPTLNKDA